MRRVLLAAAVVVALASCGDGGAETTPTEPAAATGTGPVAATDAGSHGVTPIVGVAEVTPGDGYTVELLLDLEITDAEVNIADAKPGEAMIVLVGAGELAVRNTTDGRNTSFYAPRGSPLRAIFWWHASDLGECGLEFRGDTYCPGAALTFDPPSPDGYVALGPDEFDELYVADSAWVVEEAAAERIAELAVTEPPGLVTLHGAQGRAPRLEQVCQWGSGFFSDLAGGGLKPVAVLDGGGQPLLDGGRDQFVLPNCDEA